MARYRLAASLATCASLVLSANVGDGYTLVKFNASSGARCLDGTMGGFYWKQGTELASVVVHLEGGGWCYDEQDCLARSKTPIGSSLSWEPTGVPGMDGGAHGLLSFDSTQNPDFFNWTKFHLNYCDGASYAGSGSTSVDGKPLYFRGAAILDAFIDELLSNGNLSHGGRLIVGGTSAGGLATYLHLDHFRKRMPATVNVVGMPDAGFFLDTPDLAGANLFTTRMKYVSKMQNVSGHVNQGCLAANPAADEWKCFMAEYTAPFITTPFFALQSAYDSWQMDNVLVLPCARDLATCTKRQKTAFLGFRDQVLERMKPVLALPDVGVWLSSCYLHGQQDIRGHWNTLTIAGVTAAQAFGDWYFDRGAATRHHIDCPYPRCNDNAVPAPGLLFE